MAAFERPDIAAGIFYEYLRYDDPISPEFRDRVVDGFPFLLGPLSRGLNAPTKSSSHSDSSKSGHGFLQSLALFVDSCRSHTADAMGQAGRSVREAANHTGNAARSAGDAAVEFAREMDRRRDLLVKHTVAFSHTAGKVLMRDEETLQGISRWMAGEKEAILPEVEVEQALPIPDAEPPIPRFMKIAYYAPDEIGPLHFESHINRLVLALVHFYLLLLFIVSFPGAQYRIVLRKSSSSPRRRSLKFDENSSDEENNFPLSMPESPSTPEKIQCHQYLHRRRDVDALQQKTLPYFI